ncbi:MAG: hypothetical protein V4647_12030 [Pseudomonadota bacterium]
MRRLAVALPLLIAACTLPHEDAPHEDEPQGNGPASFADDRSQPVAALLDHVLEGYFASPEHDGYTVCAATTDGREAAALPFEQEAGLMARHVSLASFDACSLVDGAWQNVDSGTLAQVFEVHSFSCTDIDHCSGFVTFTRRDTVLHNSLYRMTFADGAWQFSEDRRLIGGRDG